MAVQMLAWLIAIPALGFMTGLRSMTPIAVLCWYAHFHRMPLGHTWAFWTERTVTLVVFTLFALGEYVGDKLPNTPNRTAPFPLIARICFGGLVGALAATALRGSAPEGIFLGAVGAIAGTYIGFYARTYLPEKLGLPKIVVAFAEDLFAITASVLAVSLIAG